MDELGGASSRDLVRLDAPDYAECDVDEVNKEVHADRSQERELSDEGNDDEGQEQEEPGEVKDHLEDTDLGNIRRILGDQAGDEGAETGDGELE